MMGKKKQKNKELQERALDALDMFLFEDIINNWIRGPLGEEFEVTFAGDDYLLLHRPTGKMFQFRVKIKKGGVYDFTQEIKDQEWFIDEEDETGGYKAP